MKGWSLLEGRDEALELKGPPEESKRGVSLSLPVGRHYKGRGNRLEGRRILRRSCRKCTNPKVEIP